MLSVNLHQIIMGENKRMKRFWSFEETRRNGIDVSQFRVEAAGSNPASQLFQKITCNGSKFQAESHIPKVSD